MVTMATDSCMLSISDGTVPSLVGCRCGSIFCIPQRPSCCFVLFTAFAKPELFAASLSKAVLSVEDNYVSYVHGHVNVGSHSVAMRPVSNIDIYGIRIAEVDQDMGQAKTVGLDHKQLLRRTVIKERLKTERSRQKSYADKRRKPLEFKIRDRVLLKVSPWNGVLPQELSCVHDTFHVSNLKKCLAEPDVQVPLDEIEIDENL
ncbi:hypothetical protein Tco_1104633 [Tanacetum coccineum]